MKISKKQFKSVDEEQKFWQKTDTTKYFDTSKPVDFDFSDLKPSTKVVTLRIPEHMFLSLKTVANKKDVPYQSLMKVFLAEKLQQEFNNSYSPLATN
jgi:predicted DNA binding CopG/RHH family protein